VNSIEIERHQPTRFPYARLNTMVPAGPGRDAGVPLAAPGLPQHKRLRFVTILTQA
jgi:hypothetical protein